MLSASTHRLGHLTHARHMVQVPEELRRLREVLGAAPQRCALAVPTGTYPQQAESDSANATSASPGAPQGQEAYVFSPGTGEKSRPQAWKACSAIDAHVRSSAVTRAMHLHGFGTHRAGTN